MTASNSVAYKWHRTWGGGSDDYAWGAAVDSSGNIYLAGYTFSFGAGMEDMVLVKYDESGTKKWDHMWGGVWSDYGFGVAVDSSGNIYLAGYTNSFGAGSDDMLLVKFVVSEQPPSDRIIGYNIIVVSIASVIGVGIAITFFIRKRRKIVR